MAMIRLSGFIGESRALHPMLLPDKVGVTSRNQKPGRGDLRPWKAPSTVASVPASQGSIYRMGRDTASDANYWLSWSGRVHAVRGFDGDDTSERTYYTGDGFPKWTDNVKALSAPPYPVAWRHLGIPAPATAPTLAVSGTNPVGDIGKHEYLIHGTTVETLSVGDVYRFTVGDAAGQEITLTDPGGGDVTRASLAAQITALTGISAAVVDDTDEEIGGVRVLADAVETAFTIERKSGTVSSYDEDDVTYSTLYAATTKAGHVKTVSTASWADGTLTVTTTAAHTLATDEYVTITGVTPSAYNVSGRVTVVDADTFTLALSSDPGAYTSGGTVSAAAAVLIPSTGIDPTDTPVGDKWALTVNTNQPVAVTLAAGAGTFPSAVNAAALKSTLGAVPGLTSFNVVEGDGVSQAVRLNTTAVGVNASILIRRIVPATVDNFVLVATSTQVTQQSIDLLEYVYVYTYVSDIGEESAPSPSASITRAPTALTTISAFAAVPAGSYGVDRIRIYRTQTGTSGETEFFFLREIAYGTSSTTDDNRTLGEVLPTDGWLEPPSDMSDLTAMWKGMMAGISGNSVRVCVAYSPYAWPIAYEILPPDAKPVALGVMGQQMVIATTGRPLIVSGSSPDALDEAPIEMPQACVSADSMAAMGSGVVWASEDGLCSVGFGRAPGVFTGGLMLREDWQALVPSTIKGRMYEGLYFASYNDGTVKGFVIDPANPSGIYFLDTGYAVTHFDELRDQLYVLDGTNIKKWDAGSALTYRFRSKVFREPVPVNFGFAELVADSYPVTCRIYAGGALKHTESVASGEPFALPSGFLESNWQIELEGTAPVQGFAMATSIDELKST